MTNAQMAVLVSKILNGDSEAFSALYRATYKSAYFHAKTVLKNEQDVEDVLQEAYTTVYTRLDTLDNPEAVAAWINQIVTFTSLHKLRGSKNQASFSLDDEDFYYEPVACDGDRPDKLVEVWGTEEILSGIIEQLPEAQRLTVIMFYYDDMRVADIAKVMGCSENTVKSRLNYARKNIEAAVREEEKRGVKLYSVSPALLVAALRRLVNTMPSAPALPPAVLPAGTRAASASATSGRSSAARRVATTTGRSGGAKHAAGKTAAHAARHGAKAVAAGNVAKATAATGVTAKLVSGVAAAAILVGGIGAAAAIRTTEPGISPSPETPYTVESPIIPVENEGIDIVEETMIVPEAEPLEPFQPGVWVSTPPEQNLSPQVLYKQYVINNQFDPKSCFRCIDLDGDNTEEMLVLRKENYSNSGVAFHVVEIYTVRDNKVILLGGKGGADVGGTAHRALLVNYRGDQYLALEFMSGEWSAWTYSELVCPCSSLGDWQELTRLSSRDEFYNESFEDFFSLDGVELDMREWNLAFQNAEVLLDNNPGLTIAEQMNYSSFLAQQTMNLQTETEIKTGRWVSGGHERDFFVEEIDIESISDTEIVFTYSRYRSFGMDSVHAQYDPKMQRASFSYTSMIADSLGVEAQGSVELAKDGHLVLIFDHSSIPYIEDGYEVQFSHLLTTSADDELDAFQSTAVFAIDGFHISFEVPDDYALIEDAAGREGYGVIGNDHGYLIVYRPVPFFLEDEIWMRLENDLTMPMENGEQFRSLETAMTKMDLGNGRILYRMGCTTTAGGYQIIGYVLFAEKLFPFVYGLVDMDYYTKNQQQIENTISSINIA